MSRVRVLGAGLSGLATAVLAAGHGLDVEVRDRRPGGGGRFAGGFQVLENGSSAEDVLDELAGMGLEPRCDLVPLHEALFLDAARVRYHVRSQRPYAFLVRRGSDPGTLDGWLRAEAAAAGVAIEAGSEGGEWTADVIATGPRRADGAARERVFRTRHPDLTVVLFDPALVPTGYAYLFVRDGLATMGAAQVRRLGELAANARRAFAVLLEEFPMPVIDAEEHVQYMNFALPRSLHAGGRWYVGEAAGVQEYLFGLGNRLGLRSAALAAAALAGDPFDRRTFARRIVAPMRASILGRAAFELAGAGTVARLCRWLAGGDFRDRLIAMQRPTPLRQALARLVMAVWRDRGSSRRLPVEAWSRRRP